METLLHIPGKQKAMVMAGVMMAMFLSALDQTIVSTALPIIVKEFNALNHISWVFTAYMLSSTVSVPIYGRLSDLYGRKGFFLSSIVIFLLGSALCGLSQDMTQLIIFRAIQGIGGGAIMTNAFAIIGDLFTPIERGKWQGLMGAVFGLSSVFGPILGGLLTDHLSWRWTFYVNMPLGLLALFGIMTLMPQMKSKEKDKSIDIVGALYLTMGLSALLLGLVWGGTAYPWDSIEIILLFGFALIALSFFAVVETLVRHPIIPLNLFKNKVFSLSILATLLIGMGMFGVISYIPLFAQEVIGVSATHSGSILFPLMLGMILMSTLSGQIISRTQRYKIIAVIGMGLSTLGMFFLSRMNGETTQNELIARMIFMGFGLGMTMPVFNIVVQNIFEHSKIGLVTATTQLARSVGGTMGVALMGTMLNNAMEANQGDLGASIGEVFTLGMGIMGLGALITLMIKEVPFKAHTAHTKTSPLQEAAVEWAIESGETTPNHEPTR